MRCLWGYNGRIDGFSFGAREDSIFRIYPHSSPLGALSTACFPPVTHPSPAHRLVLGGRSRKKQQRCAQGVPPNRRGDRRHCIAPATLWCIRPVGVRVKAPGNPVRQGVASCPRQLLCLQSRNQFAPCAKLSLETSRSSRRVRKRIKSHQAETVVANGDPAGEGDDLGKGMGACLLFCRGRGLFCRFRLFRSV
jgi:hypothetical protein